METIKIGTSQHVDIDYPVAGLGERIAARLIDLGFFMILLFLVSMIIGIFKTTSIVTTVLFIIYGACYVFYNLICELFMDGQSVGKRLMKIKVISVDGSQASLGQYFIRWLFRLVDFVLTAQIGGLICIAVSEKKQRIGDLIAGTTLIRTVPRTSFEHIAFKPAEEDYVPYFANADRLTDSDIELITEVLNTYYKTGNEYLIYTASVKVAEILSFKLPQEEHRIHFLRTVVKDYNHITSLA
ncbi:MAG TPA: RDD family protein [Pedobacter sp.]